MLPKSYTRIIYNNLSKAEAQILIQLYTGDAKLIRFLAKNKTTKEVTYACEVASELVRYFLFSYQNWINQQRERDAKYLKKKITSGYFLILKSPEIISFKHQIYKLFKQ